MDGCVCGWMDYILVLGNGLNIVRAVDKLVPLRELLGGVDALDDEGVVEHLDALVTELSDRVVANGAGKPVPHNATILGPLLAHTGIDDGENLTGRQVVIAICAVPQKPMLFCCNPDVLPPVRPACIPVVDACRTKMMSEVVGLLLWAWNGREEGERKARGRRMVGWVQGRVGEGWLGG